MLLEPIFQKSQNMHMDHFKYVKSNISLPFMAVISMDHKPVTLFFILRTIPIVGSTV